MDLETRDLSWDLQYDRETMQNDENTEMSFYVKLYAAMDDTHVLDIWIGLIAWRNWREKRPENTLDNVQHIFATFLLTTFAGSQDTSFLHI